VPHNAEGGAEVFKIDYYGRNAYMAQSPQLYKQIMITAFERVFTVNRVFRAEPSVTTRHLSEYVSLDAELGFIDSWEEIMDVCEKMFLDIFNELKRGCSKELKLLGAVLPEVKKIPRIKMGEAQEIIFERTKRDNRKEPDLEPEDEKEICFWAKEKYGSEMVFITHYPVKKRPFYTQPDEKDPEYTLSFDLLFKGLEIVTGGQRINDYEKLLNSIKKWGNKPEQFSFYLQAFKYGMPPEGGFAVGLERVVKQVLGLSNVREASPFPRDMERIDQRLSLSKKKAVRKKTSKKKK
jgi:aspartyl/asparaginyl-tRNA synthetase